MGIIQFYYLEYFIFLEQFLTKYCIIILSFFMKVLIVFVLIALFNNVSGQTSEKLPSNVNKPGYGKFAPTVSADGKRLIFEANFNGYWKLYQTVLKKDNSWTDPEYITKINDFKGSSVFIGGPFLTYDENMIIFTSDCSGGFGDLDLWYSKREGENWSEPVNMGRKINTPSYEGFPSLSADGKDLYFVRNADKNFVDGKHRYKIFVAHKNDNDSWSEPVALPETINQGGEFGPKIMPDNKTLLFSSIRKGGKGDYDLYSSKKLNDNTWSTPKNLTFINTAEEDELPSVPAACDFLYFASGPSSSTNIHRIPVPSEFCFNKSIIVQGYIKDKVTGKPLEASINITDVKDNKPIGTIKSNETDGKYTIVLNVGGKYDFSCTKANYSFYSEILDVTTQTNFTIIEKNIEIIPLAKDVAFTLNNLVFAPNSVKLKEESTPELDRIVKMMQINPNMVVEIGGHTDDNKSIELKYSIELSENRANEVTKYLISKGISSVRLKAKGYGKTQPKFSNETSEGRAKNRRVEFKVIQF